MNRRIDIVLAIQSQIAITVIFFSFTFFLLDSMRMLNDFTDPFETIRICVQEHTDIYRLK